MCRRQNHTTRPESVGGVAALALVHARRELGQCTRASYVSCFCVWKESSHDCCSRQQARVGRGDQRGGEGDVSGRRVNEDLASEPIYGLGAASSSTAAVPMWVCEVGVGVLVGQGKG